MSGVPALVALRAVESVLTARLTKHRRKIEKAQEAGRPVRHEDVIGADRAEYLRGIHRAAVADLEELIEADKALDAIHAELPCVPEDMPDPMAYLRRRDEAMTRRAVALARVQGGGQ